MHCILCIIHVHCRSVRSLQQARLRVREIACGHAHTVLLTEDGEVLSCGSNERGQCGQDVSSTRPGQSLPPLPPPHISVFTIIYPSLTSA